MPPDPNEMTRLQSRCAECGEGFDPDEWELRHSNEHGDDVHERCCRLCEQDLDSFGGKR